MVNKMRKKNQNEKRNERIQIYLEVKGGVKNERRING